MPIVEGVVRPEPALSGTEVEVLWSMVEHYRATILVKCEGLEESELARLSVPPSPLSLLGLVRHLTKVERHWFQRVFLGRDLEPLYDREGDDDADFNDLASAPADQVVATFLDTCATSRTIANAHDLDDLAVRPREGLVVNLRFIAVHMVDEYARHCGHADLLRESIDGAVGD